VNVIPEWDKDGNLPVGIHRASLQEALDRFGTGPHRRTLGRRLERVCGLAFATDQVRRFIVFGSFIRAIEDWQIRRDGGRRGIIEIIRRPT
jgi:hypothetical protein